MLFEAIVHDLSWDGRSVLKTKEGKVYFAFGGIPGEKVLAEELSFHSTFGRARINRILKTSSDRRKAPCVYHGEEATQCGGCPWMMMNYSSQVNWKKKKFQELLRTENLWQEDVKIFEAPNELGYRRRAYVKKAGAKLGFLSADSHAFVPVEKCLVLSPNLQEKFDNLKASLPEPKRNPPMEEIFINENSSLENLVESKEASFEQVNEAQNETLKQRLNLIIEKFPDSQSVLELFAGSGNLTQELLAKNPSELHLMESDAKACEKLKELCPSAKVYAKDLFEADTLDRVKRLMTEVRVLLLDPPREGFDLLKSWVEALPKLEKIIYISCSPETWARDVKSLAASKWKVENVEILDMFPQTPHVEIISCLTR